VNNPGTLALRKSGVAIATVLLLSIGGLAQESPPASQPGDQSLRELDSQVRELRVVIEQLRTENAQSRAEMRELRQELQDTRNILVPLAASINGQPASPAAAGSATYSVNPPSAAATSEAAQSTPSTPSAADLESRIQKLEESAQLLGSKVNEQYKTKVETAAKYRARV